MTKRHRLNLLLWLALVCVAVLEFGLSFLPIPVGTRPILTLPAAAMADLVVLAYMRLLDAPVVARGFAAAGIFWLAILLGLAMIDPLARTIYAVTRQIGS